MAMWPRLDEPSEVYVEYDPREDRPSYDDLLTANEALARKVSLLTTRNLLLEDENAALTRRVESYQRKQ